MKIKQALLLTVFFITSFGTHAQFYYSRAYNYYYTIEQHDHIAYGVLSEKNRKLIYEKRAANNVKSSQQINVNHKEDTLSTTKTTYNTKGRIITLEKTDKKGEKYILTANYRNDTLLTGYDIKQKNKHKEVRFKYNKQGNLINLLDLKNGEKQFEINKVYKQKQLLESVSIDYSKRKPRIYKSANTINDEGKIIKTAYYKNDKLKRTWEYDCSEKGVEVKPKKSEAGVPSSSSCSWKAESNDGSYITYYRTLNGKNINLYERHYNKDGVLTNTKTYDEKERLKFESTYHKNHKIDLWYKSNGKIRRHYTEVSDPKLGVIATSSVYYSIGKAHNSEQKTHNQKGLLIELVGYSNGKKRTSSISYSYYNE